MGSRRVLSLSSTPSVLLVILFCFGPFSHINAKVNLTGPSSTPINRDLYNTSDALMEQIKALVHRHPDKFYMETFRSKNKGYHAKMTVVTYCRNRKQIDDKSKYRILLSFGQHGRELITSELALRILSILSKEQSLPNVDPLSLHDLFERLVIKVVPMENMNGRELVEAGDLCERRNGRGVDLNRNWSVDWGKKEKDYDPYEENPGTAPFSEPETQMMRKLCLSFEPHIWINVHSGMEALFMPYDHKNTTPDGLPSSRMKLMLQRLNHLHCKGRCLVGSGGGSVGYLAHGTATDYMFDVARVPMAFTFEVWDISSLIQSNLIPVRQNHIFHARTKHVEIDYHFIREKVLNKQISVQHIGTLGQVADIFTKPLSEARFTFLKSKLMVVLTPISLHFARGC